MTHINHIREMSTATIQHDAKDIEILIRLIEDILAEDEHAIPHLLTESQADALDRLQHKLKTARPDMVF